VPGTFYKLNQVLGVERVRKLFFVKEIAVLKFWEGIRGILAPDARKYKFYYFGYFFYLLLIV
jgi:hypothetical protein